MRSLERNLETCQFFQKISQSSSYQQLSEPWKFPLSRTSASAINFPTMRQNMSKAFRTLLFPAQRGREYTFFTQKCWKVLGCRIYQPQHPNVDSTSSNCQHPRPIDASELRQIASPALSWVLLPAAIAMIFFEIFPQDHSSDYWLVV